MPEPMTDTFLPLYVPVYPNILRTVLNKTGVSKKVSAINLALSGSPGIRTVLAISP